MNYWILYLETIIVSYIINKYLDLKQIKDITDAGYKINYEKIDICQEETNTNELKISSILIPGYNFILAIMSIAEYNEILSEVVNELYEMGALEKLNDIELEEYQKKPTLINAILLPRKMEQRIKNSNLLTISTNGQLSHIYYEYTNDYKDIVILKIIGYYELLSQKEQKEKALEIIDAFYDSVEDEHLLETQVNNKIKETKTYQTVLNTTKENFKNELLEQQELETNSKENTNIKKLTKKRK